MKITKIISALSIALFLTSCQKDVQDSYSPVNDSENSVLLKNYTLSKSKSTGWWGWECKDGSASGWASTKSAAKAAGKAGCGSEANTTISSPFAEVNYIEHNYASILIEDIDGEVNEHSNDEISENEIFYWMGRPYEEFSDSRKAIVYLKIFGIYTSGTTEEDIKSTYNLNEDEFYLLVNRQFSENFKLNIDDETGHFTWQF